MGLSCFHELRDECILGFEPRHRTRLGDDLMTTKINQVPAKRVETEKPLVVEKDSDQEKQLHDKAERIADRAAHKANKTEQEYDSDHNTFSI